MVVTIRENKPSQPKRVSMRKKKTDLEQLSIDYPDENEKIIPGSYTIRVSAPTHAKVEVSINAQEWQPGRKSVGYWWFDWWPMQTGDHTIIARAQIGKGQWKKTDERHCVVIGPSPQ